MELYPEQLDAVNRMFSGCLLYGKVGSGKSLTSLYFYKLEYHHKELVIITTAKKRDTKEWDEDLAKLGLIGVVDSWNNIQNYSSMRNKFFIFDEQRSSGFGKWGKSFIKIAHENDWVLLSGTPGDTWLDYVNLFVANGLYSNKTDFINQHVVYDNFSRFPKIRSYLNESKLITQRSKLLVKMESSKRNTTRHRHYIECGFDKALSHDILKNRWDYEKDEPIEHISSLITALRKVTNTDRRRIAELINLLEQNEKSIIFYNFNYELDILREVLDTIGIRYAEWNGQKHNPLPDGDSWVYLVQYTAGCEGWNCITTDTIIFYSLNYSYKVMEQAEGRIDRINTTYKDLHYYFLYSDSKIDNEIRRALHRKTKFNETAWAKKHNLY